jgi:hypothetical protein
MPPSSGRNSPRRGTFLESILKTRIVGCFSVPYFRFWKAGRVKGTFCCRKHHTNSFNVHPAWISKRNTFVQMWILSLKLAWTNWLMSFGGPWFRCIYSCFSKRISVHSSSGDTWNWYYVSPCLRNKDKLRDKIQASPRRNFPFWLSLSHLISSFQGQCCRSTWRISLTVSGTFWNAGFRSYLWLFKSQKQMSALTIK